MKLYSVKALLGGLLSAAMGALIAYLYERRGNTALAIVWGAYFLIWMWRALKTAFHRESYEKQLRARAVEKRYYREKFKRFAPVVQYMPMTVMVAGTVMMLLFVLAERGLLRWNWMAGKTASLIGAGVFFLGLILQLLLGTGAGIAARDAEEEFQNNKNPTLD